MSSRRDFLMQAGLTAGVAGASVAAALPAIGRAAPQTAAKEGPITSVSGCPSVKTPMQEVEGKVAFITGGASGIGLGIARAFVDAGMKVVLGYRTRAHLDEAMKNFRNASARVHAIEVDVTDRAAMVRAADETIKVFGKIHVLVNNAGVVHVRPLSRTTHDDWDWTMAVNLDGVFNGLRAFLPHIQAHNEGGHIVSTSSTAGLVAGDFTIFGAYSASKFAVVGMMEALRAELEDTNANIGVSVFCPGVVKTRISDAARNRPRSLQHTEAASAEPPRRRWRPQFTMDPVEAGTLVLEGMRTNALYILSHPEHAPIIQARNDALMASIPPPRGGDKPGDVEPDSIYSVERDRKQCVKARRASGQQ